MLHPPGAVAPTHPPFDRRTYTELVDKAARVRLAHELNLIDRSLTRLVEHPVRATSGHILVLRLIRDARKALAKKYPGEVLSDELEKVNPNAEPPTAEELDDVRRAVAVIREGFETLNARDRLTLKTKAVDGSPGELHVKARQYSNLLRDARGRLWLQPGVEQAFGVLQEALGRWRHETLALLGPLCACVLK